MGHYLFFILMFFGLPGFVAMAGVHERRITTWLVLGSFPSTASDRLEAPFIDNEATVEPVLGMVQNGKTWTWMDDRSYCRNFDDYIDLFTWFMPGRPGAPAGGNENVAAYAHTYVWSPITQSAVVRIATSDGMKLWLNGTLIVNDKGEIPGGRQPRRDKYAYNITLNAGWNRLLVKSVNLMQIWGFYVKLCDSAANPLNGLEYSADAPTGGLAVTTPELPKGHTGWPYVWLAINYQPYHSAPSASPFRLQAKGGKPPYAWSVVSGHLPAGIILDPVEGEFLGRCGQHAGTSNFAVQVRDAVGATATRALSLEVAERPTKFYEDGKIGGLVHGTASNNNTGYLHGPPATQANAEAREGFTWEATTTGAYTVSSTDGYATYPNNTSFNYSFSYNYEMQYKTADQAAGVRYGTYDPMGWMEGFDLKHWPICVDFFHRYLEEWTRMLSPQVLWLDGVKEKVPDSTNWWGWDLDAAYSVVRTLSPATLIIGNKGSDSGAGDWGMGDIDVLSNEGENTGTNPAWGNWPTGPSGNNLKYPPNESWRYASPPYLDWKEWSRMIVSMIAEGYPVDLDHSFTNVSPDDRATFHASIGNWLYPRLGTLKNTTALPLGPFSWGYAVGNGSTAYLHILSSPRGKSGLRGASQISLPLLTPVTRIDTVPQNQSVSFSQTTDTLTIEMKGVTLDPDGVDTILAVSVQTPSGNPHVLQTGSFPTPDYHGVEDVGLIENFADNIAENPILNVGTNATDWAGMATRRVLMRFDTQALSLPANQAITSARLILTVARGSSGAITAPASVAGKLQFDAVRSLNAIWTKNSTWDFINGAFKWAWTDLENKPTTQPPAPEVGNGDLTCGPVEIGADRADGTQTMLPFTSAGLAKLRDWVQYGWTEGMVAIMPSGSVSFYSSEAANPAWRPRLEINTGNVAANPIWRMLE